jgi:hypothetical protein
MKSAILRRFQPTATPLHGTAEQIRPHIAVRQDYVIGRKVTAEQQDVYVIWILPDEVRYKLPKHVVEFK